MLSIAFACILASAFAVKVDDNESKGGVEKVVKILNDMKSQLEKEAENDDEIMEKMVCWCETNDKAKTQAITDNTLKEKTLTANIEEYSSMAATLEDDLAQLKIDIAAANKELAEATAIREKENAEFSADEKEQLTSIGGLKGAIKTLGEKIALNQKKNQKSSLLEVQSILRENLHGKTGNAALRKLGLKPHQRREVQSFLQMSEGEHSGIPGSSEILGVLKQMQENFETNLKEAQTTEAEAAKAYSDLKAAKEKEIGEQTAQSDTKTAQLGDTVERLAAAKADLKDTTVTLAADTKFLADLKTRCGDMDAEFAMRSKMRQEEITAVSEALNILTEDEARDQFTKTYDGFVQIRKSSGRRNHAATMVLNAARKLGSPRLRLIATQISSGDVFAKIKVAVDNMVAQLKTENADEIKHRDYCIEELNQNEMQTDDAYDKKKELETAKEDLELFLEKYEEEVAADKAELSNMLVEQKKASENRAAENKDFQMTIMDQRATAEILKKALDKLKSFYAKKAAFMQQQAAKGKIAQAPPPGFGGGYQKNAGATGVMMMIEGIIKEAETVEKEATAAEQEAQAAYEEFVANTNAGVDALNKGLAEKAMAKASADTDLAANAEDLKANLATLNELHDYNGELHVSCDFVIKNFEVRQTSRAREIEALQQAKAVMSGANI